MLISPSALIWPLFRSRLVELMIMLSFPVLMISVPLPSRFTMPLAVRVIVPLLLEMPWLLAAALILISRPASMFRLPLVLPKRTLLALMSRPAFKLRSPFAMLILAFNIISLKAVRLRLPLPKTEVIALLTVMLPACEPPFGVAMSTSVPAVRAALITNAAPPLMVMLVGSSSHLPLAPFTADASTKAVSPTSRSAPEVSIKPPLPPAAPPLAKMLPLKSVVPSDHTTAVPPLPLSIALTSMVAPCSTVTLAARAIPAAPWAFPPILTVPPPILPLASIFAPDATLMSPVVATVTVPPFWPAALPEASMVPPTRMLLSPPERITSPPVAYSAEVASTMPVVLIA